MRCSQRRVVLLCATVASLIFASSAHAGITPSTSYNHLFNQPGIVTGDGQWVWWAEFGNDTGRLMGFDPTGTPDTFQTTITPLDTDPSDLLGLITDAAYDWESNSIYIASADGRVLRYKLTGATPPADAVFYDDSGITPDEDETPVQTPAPLGPVSFGSGPGEFGASGPGHLAFGYDYNSVDYDRIVYVADPSNARIQMFDADLNYVGEFSDPSWEAGTNEPRVMTIANTGYVYVADATTGLIHIFTWDGTPTGPPIEPDNYVVDIATSNINDLLYVATETHIEVYSQNNRRLGEFPAEDIGSEPLIGGIFIDQKKLYLTDTLGGATSTAKSFDLGANPNCDNEFDPVDVVAGEPAVLTPTTCTDVDGSTVFEVNGSGTEGAYEKGDYVAGPTMSTFTYIADIGATGEDWACYRASTLNGTSGIRCIVVKILPPPPAPPAPAPPVAQPAAETPTYRIDSNLSRSTGNIFIKLPGSDTFVPLEQDAVVPLGTIVDARNGVATVTWARPDGSTYGAKFWAGVFEIKQTTGKDPIGEVKLRDDLVDDATKAKIKTTQAISSAAVQFEIWIAKKKKKGKRKNKVWGDGKGKFRSTGSNSSASVRGTVWLVENYARATRTYVKKGIVDVRDKRKKKTIRLRRGKSYVAYR